MASPEERPFLDTNVLFSGLSGSNLPPAVILDRHIEGEIVIVVSRFVLDELEGVIRRKRPAILGKLATFLADTPPDLVVDPTRVEVLVAERCINAKDAPILAAAIKGGASCIVSGNTRHFTPDVAECAGIAIFAPAAYLATLAP
jgi:putative PIN family toxin of toxin-antitoxin system